MLKKYLQIRIDPRRLLRPLFFIAAILWMELVVRVRCVEPFWTRGLVYMVLFTLPAGLLCGAVCSLGSRRVNKWLTIGLTALLTVWYIVQTVYFQIFKTFLQLVSVSMAGDAITGFWRNALEGIFASLVPVLALLLPLILLVAAERFFATQGRRQERRYTGIDWTSGGRLSAVLLIAALLLQGAAVLAVRLSDGGILSPSAIYGSAWTLDLSASNFGLLTTTRLDAQHLLGWTPLEDPDDPDLPDDPVGSGSASGSAEQPPEIEQPPVWEANVLEIDFAELLAGETDKTLAKMHEYFGNREPTMKNEYTGMFAGKNLIFITAEGFWKYAVNEKYTPTLYKLANEGFVFEEFYNPLWWKSTTDGEYVACTGLIPSGQVRSFKKSGSNSMPFCMGNMLRGEGYPTMAYHNHTYTYYNRDVSHPNMGYEYYGLGNGLDVKKTWPESDLEMMEKTIPQALAGEKPFHNYYMTVSGHMNYNFLGNKMAGKHKAEVADLEMSEEARAYIACNMEFDQAMAYILEQLEAAGELENTVICISGDHYPYGMDPNTWNEFYGGEIDKDFEIYRSTLILWSGDMEEPIVVDKPCSSLDILPTLLNLFGLEYDSRLLVGRDILSDSPGLAIFSNRSFITEEGRYNARTDEWIPNEGSAADETYASGIYSQVKALFTNSVRILDNDYYGVLGLEPAEWTPPEPEPTPQPEIPPAQQETPSAA